MLGGVLTGYVLGDWTLQGQVCAVCVRRARTRTAQVSRLAMVCWVFGVFSGTEGGGMWAGATNSSVCAPCGVGTYSTASGVLWLVVTMRARDVTP